MYFAGPELKVNRATRAAIFQSLLAATCATVRAMNQPDPRRFASAWRQHAEQWLCDQGLITITITHTKTTNDENQLLLPLFSEKWAH